VRVRRVLVFARHRRDRSCLLTPDVVDLRPRVSPLDDEDLVGSIVRAINRGCGLLLDPNDPGRVSRKAQQAAEIMQSLHDPHADAHGSAPSQCLRLHQPSREVFMRELVGRNRPAVITGVVSQWPALTKWSNEFLARIMNDRPVHVKLTPDGVFGEYCG
jgi:hypothetical protein